MSQLFYIFARWFLRNSSSPTRKASGNRIAAASPVCRTPLNCPETNPTREGPVEQPRSPARANRANIAVPPFGQASAARLNVPGRMMPTESPHSAQPISPRTGTGEAAFSMIIMEAGKKRKNRKRTAFPYGNSSALLNRYFLRCHPGSYLI